MTKREGTGAEKGTEAEREGTTGRLCRWCQRPFPIRSGRGRPRRFCRQSCRQQAFMARKLAEAHGLEDDEVIVARAEVEAVQDQIAMLGQALADIERDRHQGGNAVDALEWLLEHARDAAALRIEPRWSSTTPGQRRAITSSGASLSPAST